MFRKEFLLKRQKLTAHKTLHNEDIPNVHQIPIRRENQQEVGKGMLLPQGNKNCIRTYLVALGIQRAIILKKV
jgi:hypothetical protein